MLSVLDGVVVSLSETKFSDSDVIMVIIKNVGMKVACQTSKTVMGM